MQTEPDQSSVASNSARKQHETSITVSKIRRGKEDRKPLDQELSMGEVEDSAEEFTVAKLRRADEDQKGDSIGGDGEIDGSIDFAHLGDLK